MEQSWYPRVRPRGQVTIPKDIRDELGIKDGERVKLTIERVES